MSDNIYLGNPNLKRANVAQEFTKNKYLNFMLVEMILSISLRNTLRLLVWT